MFYCPDSREDSYENITAPAYRLSCFKQTDKFRLTLI